MKKSTILKTATAAILGTAGFQAHADLITGSVLDFDPGVHSCLEGGCTSGPDVVSGSYFAFDSNDDGTISESEKIVISPFNGIEIGVAQPASGSHTDYPDGSETPAIDNPWAFLFGTGMHSTTSPITVVTDLGATKDLNFSGWEIVWGGITIEVGGGNQDCGTGSDGICLDSSTGIDTAGIVNNGSGLATITCSSASCTENDTFTLDYSATVPIGSPSGFGKAPYVLHLEGTVSSVPVPAAFWLFGSGLIGLIGVARSKTHH